MKSSIYSTQKNEKLEGKSRQKILKHSNEY